MRLLVAALVTTSVAWAAPPATAAADAPSWVVAWAMPTNAWNANDLPDGPDISGRTVRTSLRLGFGGSRVRLRLSNAQGTAPLRVTDVHVRSATGQSTAIHFAGSTSVTIPTGGTVMSDGAELRTTVLSTATVSFFVPDPVGPTTGDTTDAFATTLTTVGDHAADASDAAFGSPFGGGLLLTAVDVWAPNDGAVVAMGDSITAGFTVGQEVRGLMGQQVQGWPSWLQERVARAGLRVSVVNVGISSNKLLQDTTSGFPISGGAKGIARFDADVLAQSGLRTVLLMEGINDISANVDAPALEATYTQLAARTTAAGARLLVSPMSPSGDVARPAVYGPSYSVQGEVVRHAVNDWIRSSPSYEPGFDLDRPVADLNDPDQLALPYDSGDGLHPSVAGYQAMAGSVGLQLLTPPPPTVAPRLRMHFVSAHHRTVHVRVRTEAGSLPVVRVEVLQGGHVVGHRVVGPVGPGARDVIVRTSAPLSRGRLVLKVLSAGRTQVRTYVTYRQS